MRRSRALRVYRARWQRRALFVLGGIAVGGAAILLAWAADLAQIMFHRLVELWRYLPLLVTPGGFALSVFLTRRYFPNSQGSGIPQAIAARQFADRAARRALVSGRIAVGKILLTLLGLLCGASVGREGPTVQIGASIMFVAGHFSPRRQPGLILAGAAAGVAAAFNTPLAGIVFGIEEMSRSFELRTSGLVLATVIAAGLVSQAIIGPYDYFGTSAARLHGLADWLAIPICGLVCGALGGGFSRMVIAFAKPRRRPILFAAGCGLGAAICGLLSGDMTYGTGYQEVTSVLSQTAPPVWSFGLLKLVATTLAAVSGIPGGIFSPSLAVGAGVGADIALLLPHGSLEPIMLLGMVAYFTGVVQAPITAFVIVTEMTGNHAMLVPLMGASLIAFGTSRLICPEGIYHALAKTFMSAYGSDRPRPPIPDVPPVRSPD